ncbi:MAG: nucleotide sugar dehydrogenase [Myxococcota bacterium]
MPLAALQQKLTDRSALIAVVGLGHVGLPLSLAFHDAECRLLGVELDEHKVRLLQGGRSPMGHVPDDAVARLRESGRFEVTRDATRLRAADVIILCVPTPLGPHLEPDLSDVIRAARDVATVLRPGQLVCLESTTYPGTTREVLLPLLEATGLRCGRDFFLAYSPEREDPGRRDFTTRTTPKLVGGVDAVSGELACRMYGLAVDHVVAVRNADVAEAAKQLENVYRAVNVALVNEMKVVLSALGINIFEVIEAASTKPFGFQPFQPGPGLGGHCIPVDPFYLTWRAREAGVGAPLVELAGEVNRAMPRYVVDQTVRALNARGKPVRDARILVLGLAYKPDVDDVRESPSVELMRQLGDLGARVDYSDPHVPRVPAHAGVMAGRESVALTSEKLSAYDCVVIATHHAAFPWQLVADHAALIIDTRNALGKVHGRRDHILLA